MIDRLVIVGAGGDLTSRFLLTALAWLEDAGRLPTDFEVLAVGRHTQDTAALRASARDALDEHGRELPPSTREALVARLDYLRADATRADALAPIADGGPVAIYLALPPAVFAPAVEALARLGLPEGSRIVLEKPFGDSLASARELNRLLHRHFAEEALFRVDHFLAYQTVQNILGLRFANRLFESLWSREHIERVEIAWDETLGLEGRASYYDGVGALKDMIQNHLLQLACLVGMEPPLGLGERDLRDRKVDFLRAVRRLSREEIERTTARGRYGAGRIGGRELPSYADEEGVAPERGTETFAQVTLLVDNWRWAGVPFVLRTGKALARDRQEISVHFRELPYRVFESWPAANVLRIQLDREHMALALNVSGPERSTALRRLELDAELAREASPAYARVLLDVLEGRSTLSIRADEAEESWRIVEPVLQAWASGAVPLLEYPAGSAGPPAREHTGA